MMQRLDIRFVALGRLALGGFLVSALVSGCGGGGGGSSPSGGGGPSVVAPSITAQPANASVVAGNAATFSVTASGTAPLSYQWRKGGTNISGATSASYTTAATTSADNGAQFSVVVSNSAGNATSSAATLTVTGAGDPCAGVTCSSRGTCAVVGGTTAVCLCNPGYVANGLACLPQATGLGELKLLAGALGGSGYVDGTTNTRFDTPASVAVDAAGNVYVGGSTIRKISPAGVVSTLAGLNTGSAPREARDGSGSDARFSNARNLAVDSAGNIFAWDNAAAAPGQFASGIRKVTPAGVVTTLAPRFDSQEGAFAMAFDANDTLWLGGIFKDSSGANPQTRLVSVSSTGVVTRRAIINPTVSYGGGFAISADGQTAYWSTSKNIATIATATGAITGSVVTTPFTFIPRAFCRDGSNNFWVLTSSYGFAGTAGQLWRVPSTGGPAALVAGPSASGFVGYANTDGPGLSARFFSPGGLSCDSARGRVIVADTDNNTIRSVEMGGANTVTTLAGAPVVLGAVDGTASAARFRFPEQVVADRAGNWFVFDAGNAVIRKITAAGAVSVFAGSVGNRGLVDGTGTAARFQGTECLSGFGCNVVGLAIDADDNLYVADRGRRNDLASREPDAIRKVTPAGVVTTLASGAALSSDTAVGEHFATIAADSVTGDVYYSVFGSGIRKLKNGVTTAAVAFSCPIDGGVTRCRSAIAVDSTRRKLFIVMENDISQFLGGGLTITRYSIAGATPVVEATLKSANNLFLRQISSTRVGQAAVAPNGALLFTLPLENIILRVDASFSSVDIVAGEFQGQRGVALGPLPARLNLPTGIAVNAAGQFAVVMGRTGDIGQGRGSTESAAGWGEGAVLVTSGFTP
jgi:hypothetical protein